MTTNFEIDTEDLTDVLKMFESCCDHESPLLRGLLHSDLKHTLHEDFGLCFADIQKMIHIYRSEGIENLKTYLTNGKSTSSKAEEANAI